MENQIELEMDTLTIKGDPTKLYEELAKAQLEFTPVPKGNQGQVGQQKFKYAGYATIMRCVRPALANHGIVVLQPLHYRDEDAITTTILAGHGASIQTSFAFKADFSKKLKDGSVISDPQEFGRHHTYYRRYQLQSMLGSEGDSDADDLPDVNEPKEQFSEPAPKEAKAAPEKTNGKAKPEPKAEKPEPKPEPKVDAKPKAEPAQSTKTINELLTLGMKELGWKIPELSAFYVEAVDPSGFPGADKLSRDQKQALFGKMVELKGVTPF